MIITNIGSIPDMNYAYLSRMPDQFKTSKQKQDPKYVKNTMDFFANIAAAQYRKNCRTIAKNYNLLKGILDQEDFYQDVPETRAFADVLFSDLELPKYVQMYTILNNPLNTMVGELSKRPDIRKVRAFDDDSKSEELEYKTEIVQQLIIQEGKKMLLNDLAIRGEDIHSIEPEELNRMALEKVKEYLMSYTSLGESWGNHVLTALKIEMNLKEKSEDAFRDLLTVSREFMHIFQDNSERGFNAEVLNPKNYWKLGTPDAKYTSAISGEQNIPYAQGPIHIMELSEIIKKFPKLTTEEIDHLRKTNYDLGFENSRTNIFNNATGQDSIIYDTYSPLIRQERMILESEVGADRNDFSDLLGMTNSSLSYAHKFLVVQAYWESKSKVGLLTYWDEGVEQSMLVDDSYIEGSPNEISIEWGWTNQLYYGYRIGPDIFHIEPFKLLDYSPIIGVIHEVKNTQPRSLVDLMKPFQVLYNICMNQLFELLQKEIGRVQIMSIRHVPTPKDGDPQDALDIWEQEARNKGVMFIDDSPENTKGASSYNQFKSEDLTRTNEIQSRYNLAAQLKMQCWELVGMNEQRMGGGQATETATANQNSLVQSFAQTEPYFSAHDYVMNQFHQALLDAAQYIEGNKEDSDIRYIDNLGEEQAIKVAGSDIKWRKLKVFITSRPEDQQLLNEFRQLSQPILQNGGSVYDVSVLYTTNSLRQMQKVFKDLKEKMDEYQANTQQLEQQKVQGDQEAVQAQLQQAEEHFQAEQAMKKYEIDTRANTELATAQLKEYFQLPTTDSDGDGTPDIMEIANYTQKTQEMIAAADFNNKKLSFEMQKHMDGVKAKKKDQELMQQKIQNDKKKISIAAKKPKPKK